MIHSKKEISMQMSQRAAWLGFDPTTGTTSAQGPPHTGAVCGEIVGRFGSSAERCIHRA